MTLIPVSTSTNSSNDRNVRHHVSNTVTTSNGTGATCSFGDISSLVDVLNQNTRAILQPPFAEVQRDCEASKLALERAKDNNDNSRVMFYELAVYNFFMDHFSLSWMLHYSETSGIFFIVGTI